MYMMENSFHWFFNIVDTAQQRISEFGNKPIDIIHT